MSYFLLKEGDHLHFHSVARALFPKRAPSVQDTRVDVADAHHDSARRARLHEDEAAKARGEELWNNVWLSLP